MAPLWWFNGTENIHQWSVKCTQGLSWVFSQLVTRFLQGSPKGSPARPDPPAGGQLGGGSEILIFILLKVQFWPISSCLFLFFFLFFFFPFPSFSSLFLFPLFFILASVVMRHIHEIILVVSWFFVSELDSAGLRFYQYSMFSLLPFAAGLRPPAGWQLGGWKIWNFRSLKMHF